MGQIKWYKRDPDQALKGMFGLSLEERGAYNTVLDLIYLRDGKLPDDDRFISGYMSVDVRVWRRIKKRLMDLDKLSVKDGLIHDDVADQVVDEALARVVAARDAGKASAKKRTAKQSTKPQENNEVKPTDVQTDVSTGASTNKNKNKNTPLTPQGEKVKKTVIPEDWKTPPIDDLPPKAKECAKQWPSGKYETHAEAFHSYWRSHRKTMADWKLTWANRIINIHDQVMRSNSFAGGYRSNAQSTPKPMYQQILDEKREKAQ